MERRTAASHAGDPLPHLRPDVGCGPGSITAGLAAAVAPGRRLGSHMAAAGLERVAMSARYEVYDDRAAIAGYLAERLDEDDPGLAAALPDRAARPGGMFAQAWVAATGWVPLSAGPGA